MNAERIVTLVDGSGTAYSISNPLPTSGSGGGGVSSSVVASQGGTWTVTANQGTAAAKSSAWPTILTDSVGNQAAITAAAALKVDGSAVTQPISVAGTVSTANSSTTPLTSGTAFTGTSEDVSKYSLIDVSVFADQASATGGLSLQFSSDGTHWDIAQAVTISASVAAVFTVCPCAQFFRIVYTNGGTGQGTFRLQTVYRPVASVPTLAGFQDVNATITPTTIVQRVAADMLVQDPVSNVSNRVRSALSLVPGVGGGAHMGMAAAIYETSSSKFWPWQGTMLAGGFVQGPVAHGASVTGNPNRIGARAISIGTNPTEVSSGQATDIYALRNGVPFYIGGTPNIQTLRANFTSSTINNTLIAGVANTAIVVTGFLVTVDNGCSVNVPVRMGFDAATTPTTSYVIGSHPNVAPGSGFGRGGGSGIIGMSTSSQSLLITSGVPTGGSIDVDLTYFTIAAP